MRVAIVVTLTLVACGETSSVGDLGDLAASNGDASMDAAPMCPASSPDAPDGGVCLNAVSGKMVDETGAGLPNLVTSVCAVACFFGMTRADGTFTNDVYQIIDPSFYALEAHGRPNRASWYAPLPPLVGMSASYAQPLLLPSLPASGPLIALDQSAQTLTSGDVTLLLAAGTKVMLDVEDVVNGDPGRQLRVVKIAPPTKMPFVDASAPPDALYGFSPFEVRFSQPAQLTFANSAGLAANAAVNVLELSGLVGVNPPAGHFSVVATAHVTADGSQIVMDSGQGVSGLTWIALRHQ
jgi:hypothetical protein